MKHILIVDDVAVNLQTLKFTLGDKYRTSLVTSGKMAIDFLSRNSEDFPDLILMDIRMPNMDGIETVRRIREKYGETTPPVIYVTAVSDRKTIVNCFNEGLSDYIVKPFDPDNLIEKIETALNK